MGLNEDNSKLKLENVTLKVEIKKLNSQISLLQESKDRYKNFFKIHESDEYIIESQKKEIADLKEKLNNSTTSSAGGRPSRFNDQEKETIKMYRLQGKSIRQIAEIFDCSAGLVHKIINE